MALKRLWFGPCNGVPNCHRFGPSPTIDDPAKRLSAFRKANNLPRAGITEATEDVDTYTCTRLGNATQWCHDTAAKPYLQVNPMAQPPRPCGGCGHKLNPT